MIRILIFIILYQHRCDCDITTCQYNLLQYLFNSDHYDKDMHPFQYSEPLMVSAKVTIYQILELNERRQELDMNLWFIFYWRDPHMTWDPSQYCGINETTVQWDRIWTPEIKLYNRSDVNLTKNLFTPTLVKVYSNGSIQWPTLAFVQTSCKIDMKLYPFDSQKCILVFGSWSEPASKLILVNATDSVNMESYVGNDEWELTEATISPTVRFYEEYFSQLVLTICLQRRAQWFMYNLIAPGFLLMLIGLLSFFLGPESGEKIALSITLFLTMMLLQLTVAENQPESSTVVPVLTQFFTMSIFMLGLATSASIITTVVNNKGERGHRPSRRMQKLGKQLAIVMFMSESIIEDLSEECEPRSYKVTPLFNLSSDVTFSYKNTSHELSTMVKNNNSNQTHLNTEQSDKKDSSISSPETDEPEIIKKISELLGICKKINTGFEKYLLSVNVHNKKKLYKSQWHALSLVMDRFLFIVFVIGTLVWTLVIFLEANNY